jgi:ABC-type phosphate transport system substrate-binding protein
MDTFCLKKLLYFTLTLQSAEIFFTNRRYKGIVNSKFVKDRERGNQMKKLFTALTAIAMSAFLFTGCAQKWNARRALFPGETENPPAQSPRRDITVISREDGSGTRGAFIELLEIQKKNASAIRPTELLPKRSSQTAPMWL